MSKYGINIDKKLIVGEDLSSDFLLKTTNGLKDESFKKGGVRDSYPDYVVSCLNGRAIDAISFDSSGLNGFDRELKNKRHVIDRDSASLSDSFFTYGKFSTQEMESDDESSSFIRVMDALDVDAYLGKLSDDSLFMQRYLAMLQHLFYGDQKNQKAQSFENMKDKIKKLIDVVE